ncbi:MAG: hypothetical protein IJZ70_08170 [Bacteroidales bacterium]|nr:hypothetical protein [Bacteroidales bacterium]MBQ8812271.1 hypothetical protein [Bacteroidales bacterium]
MKKRHIKGNSKYTQPQENAIHVLSESDLFGNSTYINGSTAMKILGLSRHSFEKCLEKGVFRKYEFSGRALYDENDIERFMSTTDYEAMLNGVVDKRNTLNDLTGKEWIPETKSYMYQKGLGASHPHAMIEMQHPAPFSFQDVQSLIRFFTKKRMNVLDPFGGVGSTAKACELSGRVCTSIELSEKYHDLSIQRLETEVNARASEHHRFLNGDSRIILQTLENESMDFVITSPPYWGILHKQDQKVKKNRVNKNLDTRYSDDEKDLGNIEDYDLFLQTLCDDVLLQCARILKTNRYMALVVSDFRDKGEYISFHSDLLHRLNKAQIPGGGELVLQGTKILIQNHKSLHPYGYPFSYVENIHHQYILIFRKRLSQ